MFVHNSSVAVLIVTALNGVLGFERYRVVVAPTLTDPKPDVLPPNEVVIQDLFNTPVTLHVRNVKGHTVLNLGRDGQIARGRPFRIVGTEDFVQVLAERLYAFTKDPHLKALVVEADKRHEDKVLHDRAERKATRLAAKLGEMASATANSSAPAIVSTQTETTPPVAVTS